MSLFIRSFLSRKVIGESTACDRLIKIVDQLILRFSSLFLFDLFFEKFFLVNGKRIRAKRHEI